MLITCVYLQNNIGSSFTSSTDIVKPLRKKALLIGINYPEGADWGLRGPQNEVREFRELLSSGSG